MIFSAHQREIALFWLHFILQLIEKWIENAAKHVGGIRILLWVAVQSKRLLNNNFRTCTVAYAMLFVQHRLPTWPIYISACTCCCCGISVQHKESRKLKVILFEFLLHKCGEFECAKLQMQSITKYICYVRYSLSHCTIACIGS